MSAPLKRTQSFEKSWHARYPYLSYVVIFFSQLPRVLDKTDVIVGSSDAVYLRVANVFPDGHWRWIALLRSLSRLLLVLAIPFIPVFLVLFVPYTLVRFLYELISSIIGSSNEQPSARISRLYVPMSTSATGIGVRLFSKFVWSMWAFNADADTFEKMYVQAWTEEYINTDHKSMEMVSIFVDNEVVRVPIPVSSAASDEETCELLMMWYSWLRVKKGFGEILLPKRLVRVDKVKLNGGDASLGRRVRTLEFGRNGHNSVEYLRNRARIPPYQNALSMSVTHNSDSEGLEFIRAWDSFAISIITLLPLVLSLAFAGAWMGVSISKHQVDAQVAAQTAFTIASYIITAGALVIALFAFLDGSSQRNNESLARDAVPDDDRSDRRSSRHSHDDPIWQPPFPVLRSSPPRTRERVALEAERMFGMRPPAIAMQTDFDSSYEPSIEGEISQPVKSEGPRTFREV